MFRNQISRVSTLVMITMVTVTLVSGCTGSSIPESVTITLPDGTQTEATLGSGVLSLANTTWAFYAGSVITGTPFVVINFGPEGNLETFEDNTLAQEVFGDTIIFDGQRHNTTYPGLSYEAATYGAETSDATGFSFVGQLNAFVIILGEVANGSAEATGTFDPNDPGIMTGDFSFDIIITVEIPGVPTENTSESFTFIAQKVAG